MTPSAPPDAPYAPRFPSLSAFALCSVWVLLLCLPMLSGEFLVGPFSDQIYTGVPFRWFGAEEWRRTGAVPLWNPYMFGGLPFVGAMNGAIFYPTAWLRLLLPVDVAMNLSFASHLVLAGFFAYVCFRTLGIGWAGAVVGGIGYQLTGVVASLVQPGHDGKLYVSVLLPLMLAALVLAIRRRQPAGYTVLALAVGLGLVSPHIQLMQYTLILAGLFALYLAFVDEERPATTPARIASLALAAGAVAVGFGIAMIQLLPFLSYLPYAARSAGAQGWEYATSYAMPPEHVVDWLVSDFTGVLRSYWGRNFFKLHSEYLGAATLVLASVGIASRERRRLIGFFGGAFVLFVLVSLGAHTPFYRLWYEVVPFVKVTRAPGMAFFIPAFAIALFAAIGVERLGRAEGQRVLWGALGGAGVLLLLGASGGLGQLAEAVAASVDRTAVATGLPISRVSLAEQNANAVAYAALRAALFAGTAAGLGLATLRGRIRAPVLALGLAGVAGGDLFLNARRFFTYSPPAAQLYADDDVTRRFAQTPPPYRVLDPERFGIYPTAYLMGKRIPNALGHHGNELHAYDELMGGKNVWRHLLSSTRLWNLLAIRYVLLGRESSLPGYHQVLANAATAPGARGYVYEADTVPPYARVVPTAVKVADAAVVAPTLLDRRFDYDRVVLLEPDAPAGVARLEAVPLPSPSRARVTDWAPGRMTIRLDPPPPASSFLLVSENWYPDWHASVDGRDVRPLRGNGTLIVVPVDAGARDVRLAFRSAAYARGRSLSLASLGVALAWLIVPVVRRRRRG